MIDRDDPRLTAYALGELDEKGCAAVEAALEADPTLREEVAATQEQALALTQALASEPPASLDAAPRLALLEEARAVKVPAGASILRRWLPFGMGAAAAAALLLMLAIPSIHSRSERTIVASRESSMITMPQGAASSSGPILEFNGDVPLGRASTAEFNAARSQSKVQGFVLFAGDGDNGDADGCLQNGRCSLYVPLVRTFSPTMGPIDPVTGRALVGRLVFEDSASLISGISQGEESSGEAYAQVAESPFLRTSAAPLSTFSIDVDTASYANVRRMLNAGQLPPGAAVRIEEMLNYFPYRYAPPTDGDPFAVHLEAAACPWNVKHRLVRVAIKGREIERKARPPMNLVFLLDVSGSMDSPDKLPLVKASLRMLLEELSERDTVAIAVYAGASGLVLSPTSCEQKAVIQKAIDDLTPGGGTNGAAGIQLAYDTAALRFLKEGVNRVVLATDGDFNVGMTSHDALLGLITERAKSGVFLTCLGYGMGNLKDSTLELLADKGNGNYGYIDSTKEARKVLVDGAAGTLVTIAKDVKIQVEFNPARVLGYRLVGYDNRRLADKDFNDDTKDAGEIGAGHTVTALYEIIPVGAEEVVAPVNPEVDPLRYGQKPAAPPTPAPALPAEPVVASNLSAECMTIKLRFKQPDGATSVKREFPFVDGMGSYDKASADFQFASAVAAFGLLLKASPYAGNASLDTVAELATAGLADDAAGYRKEFVELVAKAKQLRGGK